MTAFRRGAGVAEEGELAEPEDAVAGTQIVVCAIRRNGGGPSGLSA